MTLVLTAKQKETFSNLKSGDFDKVSSSMLTRTLSKFLDTKQTGEEILPLAFGWEKAKKPDLTFKDAKSKILRRIKAKDDKAMYREIVSDISSFPDVSKPKTDISSHEGKHDGDGVPKTFTEQLPSEYQKGGSNKGANGSVNKLDAILESVFKEQEEKSKAFSGEGRKVDGGVVPTPTAPSSSSIFDYIDMGTDAYKKNKKSIDAVLAVMSEKNIADGTVLSKLATLQVPEIGIWSAITKSLGMGFSKTDNANLEKLISRDPNVTSELGTADTIQLVLKTLVSPDNASKLIQKRAGQVGEDISSGFSDFLKKITGEQIYDESAKSAAEIVENRRKNIDKDAKRREELDELMGIEKPIDWNGITPTGTTDRPFIPVGDRGNESAYDILKPTNIPELDTSAGQDFMVFLRKLLPVPQVNQTKETYLASLKDTDPGLYDEYQKRIKQQQYRVRKIKLSKDSDIDSGDLNNVKNMSIVVRDMLKIAASKKDLISNEQIEQIYDVSSTLESIANGEYKVSYSDFEKLSQGVIDMLPTGDPIMKDSLARLSKAINGANEDLGTKFKGDTDLSLNIKIKTDTGLEADTDGVVEDTPIDGDPEDDVPELEFPEEKQPPTEGGVREEKLDSENKIEENFTGLRYRYKTGGQDRSQAEGGLVPTRLTQDINNRVANRMLVDIESIDPLATLSRTEYKRRYGKTIPMPQTDRHMMKLENGEVPQRFIQLHKPVWIQYHPPMNDGSVMVDKEEQGVYPGMVPRDVKTPFQRQLMNEHTNYFPDGVENEHRVGKKFDFMVNQRFTRK